MGVPSGVQVELVHSDQRAVVVEVGGGLREYAVAGRPVLDGYGAAEMGSSGRGQTLIPWPTGWPAAGTSSAGSRSSSRSPSRPRATPSTA